ncbi:hypothetical protein FRC17_006194, partial [Serendipita sp. 399]
MTTQASQMWEMFPNIQVLGSGRRPDRPFPSPPPHHPLRHLRLISRKSSLDMALIVKELEIFPRVTHLHIRAHDLSGITMDDVRELCLKRSVIVVDVPTVNMDLGSKAPS